MFVIRQVMSSQAQFVKAPSLNHYNLKVLQCVSPAIQPLSYVNCLISYF